MKSPPPEKVNAGQEEEKAVFLSPIASPLAEDALAAKILKTLRAGVKKKSVRRGVKEVVKALRKATGSTAGKHRHTSRQTRHATYNTDAQTLSLHRTV